MNPIVKNTLAVVVGIILGAIVNLGILLISGPIIFITSEGGPDTAYTWQMSQFFPPFLAHSLGTLIAAIAVVKIAVSH